MTCVEIPYRKYENMPPKTKLHKNTGKPKTIPPSKPVQSNNENPSEPTLSPELIQQFELELCWCIQQLQSALKSGKLNPKQIQDHTKALNTLMNNSAPLVKKRQVMRLSFGDYRAKMAAEDKKLNRVSVKVKVAPASPNKKSVFLKKAVLTSSSNSFRFNFPKPEDYVTEDVSNIKIEDAHEKDNFHFAPSDNTFKFNFNVSE